MAHFIFVRHGQSQFNLENRFTGWMDVPLTDKGVEEAKAAGEKIKNLGIQFDCAFTSKLQRAQKTLGFVQEALGTSLPVTEDEALNERHYGDLQGKNKAETAEEFGAEQVHIWRRSFDVPPPGGESLKDTAARTLPYFNSTVIPRLQNGENVLMAAHGNSLRSIVMEIENLSPEEILKTEIATGDPWAYEFIDGKFIKK